ncbi:TIGR03546 family protein [Candidatus Termititenax persephonae]|uniref:TIGR03546 family protein n=1 Tax=Candidatus Termititenax persephonae TaxID=2218525 RepID=A0A388TJG7_9BACT|nr:TIGR03546 family protein [Candidatus Termititenax persephonae]
MPNVLKLLKKYHETLSRTAPKKIAAGFVLGMFLGLLPLSINSVIILVLIFAVYNDKTTSLLAALIFGALGFAIDPLAHRLGLAALQASFLRGAWTVIYNLPFLPFTGFNNSIVMGNTLIGIVLAVPGAFLVRHLVLQYRGSPAQAKVEAFLRNKLVSGLTAGFKLLDWRTLFIRKPQ